MENKRGAVFVWRWSWDTTQLERTFDLRRGISCPFSLHPLSVNSCLRVTVGVLSRLPTQPPPVPVFLGTALKNKCTPTVSI